ncbi:MAG TPA: type II secretion system protein GspF [Planctomycetes bacterium]|nr:type II secretion system protein GspF [Planctomycetota bacterium]
MPIYEYKALTPKGSTQKGIVDADSARDARTQLRKKKLLVTEIHESQKGMKRGLTLKLRKIQGANTPNKKRNEQVAAATRQLASLLGAGIPLIEGLRAIIEQAPDREIEQVFRDIREKVSTGISFGEAVAHHPAYFSELYSAMVKAGEASGALDKVLAKLANYLLAQSRMRNRVGAAMIYPMIMIAVGILVVAILITFVVPKISQMFRSRGKELPLPTEILIGTSDFFVQWWWAVALGVAVLSLLFNWFLRIPRGRLLWDTFILKLPVFGDLMLKQSVGRFATTFSTLLGSGVPVIQSIQVTKDTLGNKVLENALQKIHDHILEGADIATPMRLSGAFPPVVSYMVAVGEQAGNLEEVLEQVAQTYEEEVELATQKMTTVLEPLIIVLLAGIVAGIILSIILPLMQINKISG